MWMLALCLVVHFIADFLLQSREMGKKKSTDLVVLLQHLGIQFVCFFVFLFPIIGVEIALCFALANSIIHGVIDWNIWRAYKLYVYKILCKQHDYLYKKISVDWNKMPLEEFEKKRDLAVKEAGNKWQYWEDHWFYATIGLDQLLHALTLIVLVGIML